MTRRKPNKSRGSGCSLNEQDTQELNDKFAKPTAPSLQIGGFTITKNEHEVLIGEGEYELTFIKDNPPKKSMWGQWKLEVEFSVIGPRCEGSIVKRHYNFKITTTGELSFAPRSNFRKEMKKLFGDEAQNYTSLSDLFGDRIVIGEVNTVHTDREGDPQEHPYSKVRRLLRIKR